MTKNRDLSMAIQGYEKDRLRIIFEYSPIAIWEEDFTAVAKLRDLLVRRKVENIRPYLKAHPELVVSTFRQLKVLDVNQAALELYGANSKKELLSKVGRSVHKEAIQALVDEFATFLEGKLIFETEFRSKTLQGKMYDVAMRVSIPEIYKDSFKRAIVTFENVSVQKNLERHLRKLSQTDSLTHLLNHKTVQQRLEAEFARAKRYHLDLAVLILDLDHFKNVNDTYGHLKGDQVIKSAANIIKGNLRDVDIVGRYGGDEFIAILPDTPQAGAQTAAMRLHNMFVEKSKSQLKGTTVSIGVGCWPGIGIKESKDLMTKADKAMYSAKKSGRNTVSLLE